MRPGVQAQEHFRFPCLLIELPEGAIAQRNRHFLSRFPEVLDVKMLSAGPPRVVGSTGPHL